MLNTSAIRAARPLPSRQSARAVPAQPAPSRPSAPRHRDSLSLGTDRNGDGALTLDELQYSRAALRRFARLDLDEDGRLTTDELKAPKRRACEALPPQAEVAEPKNPPGKPAAEPAEAQTPPETAVAAPEVVPDTPELPRSFGYATQYAHPVWQLASQLGADMDALLQANGWDDPGASIPAGAVVQVPDTPTSRSLARQYGGAITENTAQSAEAEAPQAPTATATATETAAPAGATHYISQYAPEGQDQAYNDATSATVNGVWQAGASQCGAASAAMALRAFGYGEGLTDAQLILDAGSIVGTDRYAGTGPYVMQQGLDALPGFRAELQGPTADVDWIRERLTAGDQVLANGDYYAMPPHVNPGAIGTAGHYVAVVGYDAATDTFQVHDPAYNNGGAPLTLGAADLANFINANSNGGYQVAVGREA